MSMPTLSGDDYSSEQLLQELMSSFQMPVKTETKKQKPVQKVLGKKDQADTILSQEMIDELKNLREKQKSSSKQNYIGVAKTSK